MQRSTRPDLHASITQEILTAIEAGALTMEMPWHRQAFAGMPRNPVTKNVYRGMNTLILWMARNHRGYASSFWASYLQWKTLGAQVRRDEKGTLIVFYKKLDQDPTEADGEQKPRAVLRHSYIFNADQVEGWMPDGPRAPDETLQDAEQFVGALGSDVRYGSDNAYYQPATDRIFMPNRVDFYETSAGSALEGFFAVLLHEHIHWTGHAKRLARDLTGKFGSESYAMEELVAELGAAFLCASLGISTSPRPDHAAYIQSWVKVLKEQKTAIFAAASAASAACMFLEDLAAQNAPPKSFANPA